VTKDNIDRVKKAISAALERVNEENVERIEKVISAGLERE
jgi:hypothetical protein